MVIKTKFDVGQELFYQHGSRFVKRKVVRILIFVSEKISEPDFKVTGVGSFIVYEMKGGKRFNDFDLFESKDAAEQGLLEEKNSQ